MKKYLTVLLLALLPIFCQGQAKVYTMKVKLADFPGKTTMVVLDGDKEFKDAMRSAVSGSWRLSPYDFCTSEDYAKMKDDNSLYFLRPVIEEGKEWLVLSKGGKQKTDDSMKAAFELTRIPVGREFSHFGAFIDMLQIFTEKAMESDRIAYSGMRYNNLGGVRTIKDARKNDPSMIETVKVGESVIIYDTLTHEILSFKK